MKVRPKDGLMAAKSCVVRVRTTMGLSTYVNQKSLNLIRPVCRG